MKGASHGPLVTSLGKSISTGPGTPVVRDVERLAHDARNVVRALDQVAVLDDRVGDARDVGLLERVLAQARRDRLAGEHDHRHRVHHRRQQTGHRYGRARTRGHEHDARLAGGARVAIGHVGGALLVAHQDQLDCESTSASKIGMAAPPERPKTTSTPSRSRHWISFSAPVGTCPVRGQAHAGHGHTGKGGAGRQDRFVSGCSAAHLAFSWSISTRFRTSRSKRWVRRGQLIPPRRRRSKNWSFPHRKSIRPPPEPPRRR